MLKKIILVLTLLVGTVFFVSAKSELKEITTDKKTGEQDFSELKPYRSSSNPNEVEFRVLMPKKSDTKIMMENKASGYTISSILFGKTVNGTSKTFWIEVTALQIGGTYGDLFSEVTPYILEKLHIASTDGIITFNINRNEVKQFNYYITEVNERGIANNWSTYYLRERVRIPLTEKEFNAIRNHTHLGFQVEASTGMLVPIVFEKKAWTSVQEKLNKLYEIQHN